MTDKFPTLTLGVSGGHDDVVLESTCLIVFIDETGHELFSDPQHPVFGLGGCALLVSDYVNYVRPLWLQMKERHFGGADVSLHAAELNAPTPVQLKALADIFASKCFGRVAAVASGRSLLPDEYSPYQLVSRALLARIERIAPQFKFSRLALLMESSERADRLASRHIGPYGKADIDYLGRTDRVSIDHYFIPKTINEPGAEIADFIMHAAGGQVRSDLTHSPRVFRKDFSAVFRSIPRELVEYMSIQKAVINDA